MEYRDQSNADEQIRRFGIYRIIEHLALIALFVVLSVTGLPQKFYYIGISQSVIVILGGVDNLRLLHHLAGVLFAVLAIQHIIANFVGVAFLRWEPAMLVTLKDAQDAFQNVRYYLGLDDRPAQCGRYTYKEKCIYWLVVIGGIPDDHFGTCSMVSGYRDTIFAGDVHTCFKDGPYQRGDADFSPGGHMAYL